MSGSSPSLPAKDPDLLARQGALAKRRDQYEFDQSFFGYSLVKQVPTESHFDAGYLATATEHLVQIGTNHIAAAAKGAAEEKTAELVRTIRGWFTKNNHPDPTTAVACALQQMDETLKTPPSPHPLSLAQYEGLYPLLPNPSSVTHWKDDWFFAWQRLAGCNPILIAGVRSFPEHFRVTDEHLRQVDTSDSLRAAGEEGRLFLVDYPMMARVPTGSTDGRQKYLTAPMAAFIRTKKGPLLPFAIQCGQSPGSGVPTFSPRDGTLWQMAKTQVQVADANFQGIVSHLGYCHLVMESTIIAAERQLAPNHPIKILLRPHFEFTLAANDVAKRTLIGPGGNTDRLQSGTIQGSTDLVLRCLREYPICRTDAPTAFADRAVDDREGLPEYPFRDDALASWKPITEWAEAYVRLYYATDADVAGDTEIQSWVREMEHPEAGNLCRVTNDGSLNTVLDLAMAVARVIYTATTFHSAINYASWDFLSFPPNMPAAAWGPGPNASEAPVSEEALYALMTPLDLSFATIKLMWTIMMTRNHLGKYPSGYFVDARVAPLLSRFQGALEKAEEVIKDRNKTRRVPYTYLTPSWIPQSIHV